MNADERRLIISRKGAPRREWGTLATPVPSSGATPVPSAGATGQAGQARTHTDFLANFLKEVKKEAMS